MGDLVSIGYIFSTALGVVLVKGFLIQPLLGINRTVACVISFVVNLVSYLTGWIFAPLVALLFGQIGAVLYYFSLTVLIEFSLLAFYLISSGKSFAFSNCLRTAVIMNVYTNALIVVPFLTAVRLFPGRL